MSFCVKATRAVLTLIVLTLPAAVSAQRVTDRVRMNRGSETGEITEMTPLNVTLNKGAPSSRSIEVNEIKSVIFDGEPVELSQARVNANNGAFREALEKLAKIDINSIRRDYVREDVEFYKAWSTAHLALAGDGEIAEAGRQLNAFVRAHPQNFHYLAAVETMGNLLVAGQRYENARKQYADLAKAPWPDYRMRAAVLTGRALQAEGKHTEAIQQFDVALAIAAEGPESQNQRLAATLGKAVSLAETGNVEESVAIIEKVIHDADSQEKELHARAYNALGRCYAKAGKTKDALLAYLHVDVLYNNVPEAHAEALAHLVPLWQAIGQEERAREARQLLDERYGGSRWAKQVR